MDAEKLIGEVLKTAWQRSLLVSAANGDIVNGGGNETIDVSLEALALEKILKENQPKVWYILLWENCGWTLDPLTPGTPTNMQEILERQDIMWWCKRHGIQRDALGRKFNANTGEEYLACLDCGKRLERFFPLIRVHRHFHRKWGWRDYRGLIEYACKEAVMIYEAKKVGVIRDD